VKQLRELSIRVTAPERSSPNRRGAMLPGELFHPGSIAVVGASRNPEKVGYGVFANLVQAGSRGRSTG